MQLWKTSITQKFTKIKEGRRGKKIWFSTEQPFVAKCDKTARDWVLLQTVYVDITVAPISTST